MADEIRRIGAGEWRELRDLRLRALTDAPDAFTATFRLPLREGSDIITMSMTMEL
ncbi:MAG: hypothetical protein ACXVEI_11425 [Actinomycetota bacterium]